MCFALGLLFGLLCGAVLCIMLLWFFMNYRSNDELLRQRGEEEPTSFDDFCWIFVNKDHDPWYAKAFTILGYPGCRLAEEINAFRYRRLSASKSVTTQ